MTWTDKYGHITIKNILPRENSYDLTAILHKVIR